MSPARRLYLRLLLAAAASLGLLRLSGFVQRFGSESLQQDFAAYYTAGEAQGRGLDPYRTHPDVTPPVWDGSDQYRHSRFLYPPLAALVFRPLALLPYRDAKLVWMGLSLLCVAAALWSSARDLGPRWLTADRALLLAAIAALFHPLLVLLERGQVDALTLLLVSLALRPLVRGQGDRASTGVWLALATVLKLNAALLLLFLGVRRLKRALAAYALAGLALLGVQLATSGVHATLDYAASELPRIAAYGENGTAEMKLTPETLARLRAGAPEGSGPKDGSSYRIEGIGFAANASLARIASKHLGGATGAWAVAIAAASAVLLFLSLRGRRELSALSELAFWQAALAAILLAGPLTWAMNAVWLLPAALLLIETGAELQTRAQAIACAAGTLGLVLAGIPDSHGFPLLLPAAAGLSDLKYVAAEALALASAALLLAGSTDRRA